MLRTGEPEVWKFREKQLLEDVKPAQGWSLGHGVCLCGKGMAFQTPDCIPWKHFDRKNNLLALNDFLE